MVHTRSVRGPIDVGIVGAGTAGSATALLLLFVAAGFEHSVANLYLIPMGLLLAGSVPGGGPETLTLAGLAANLVPVVLGNVVGGGVLVALVYHVVYRRGRA